MEKVIGFVIRSPAVYIGPRTEPFTYAFLKENGELTMGGVYSRAHVYPSMAEAIKAMHKLREQGYKAASVYERTIKESCVAG